MPYLKLLLDWRVWVAVCFVVSVSGVGWEAYRMGENYSLLLLQQYKLEQSTKYIALQKQYAEDTAKWQESNQKVTENYESLKVATSVAVGALDAERMRLLAVLAKRTAPTPGQAQASPGADDGGETGVLTECINSYASVAGQADRLADKVTGLQDYIVQVCQANP